MTPRARWRLAVLVGCVVVVLACLATLVYVALDRRGGETADASEQTQREELISVVSQFVLRINTYGPQLLDDQNRMPSYVEDVSELMTAEFAAGFAESVVIPERQVADAGYGRAARVYAVGVATMSAESATVLVAFGRTDSYPDPDNPQQRVEVAENPERWQVELLRSGEDWLVNDYAVIPEVPVGEGEAPDLPSPGPTQQPGGGQTQQPGGQTQQPGGPTQQPGGGQTQQPGGGQTQQPGAQPSGGATP